MPYRCASPVFSPALCWQAIPRHILWSALLAGMLGTTVYGFGLGELQLQSSPNQPLRADIDINALKAGERGRLRPRLASPQFYEQTHTPYPPATLGLVFSVAQRENGQPYIAVSSERPVLTPGFSLILEVDLEGDGIGKSATVREYEVVWNKKDATAAADTKVDSNVAVQVASSDTALDAAEESFAMPPVAAHESSTATDSTHGEGGGDGKNTPNALSKTTAADKAVIAASALTSKTGTSAPATKNPLADDAQVIRLRNTVQLGSVGAGFPAPVGLRTEKTRRVAATADETVGAPAPAQLPATSDAGTPPPEANMPLQMQASIPDAGQTTDPAQNLAETSSPQAITVESTMAASDPNRAGGENMAQDGHTNPDSTMTAGNDKAAPDTAVKAEVESQQHSVTRGDTLNKIAFQYMADGITLEQVLLAIYRANPDAFAQNMNILWAGSTLTIPDRETIESIAPDSARREMVAQAQNWLSYRAKLASNAPTADNTPHDPASGSVSAPVQDPLGQQQDSSPGRLTLAPELAQGREQIPEADAVAKRKALEDLEQRGSQLAQINQQLGQQLNGPSTSSLPATPDAAKAPRPAPIVSPIVPIETEEDGLLSNWVVWATAALLMVFIALGTRQIRMKRKVQKMRDARKEQEILLASA